MLIIKLTARQNSAMLINDCIQAGLDNPSHSFTKEQRWILSDIMDQLAKIKEIN